MTTDDVTTQPLQEAGGRPYGVRSGLNGNSRVWTNWNGAELSHPSHYVRARSVEHVQEVMAAATSAGRTVRPMGSSHSLPPLVKTDDVLIDIRQLSGVTDVDRSTLRATVGGGSLISALGSPLWDAGVSLINQGGIDSQTIAGAISTGTHGAGLRCTSLSGTLTGADIVTASGELVSITEEDPRLPAVMTSLGSLGVMVNCELAVTPSYHLAKYLKYQPLNDVLESWWEESKAHRHYSFWWGPAYGGLTDNAGLPPVPSDIVNPCLVRIFDEVEPKEASAESGKFLTDRAYRVYPDVYDELWEEYEYHVPYVDSLDALQAITPLLAAYPDVFPVDFRTVKGEPGLLAPAHGRDSVAISVCRTLGNPDNARFFTAFHATLAEFGGRPHWGKGHAITAEYAATIYPRYGDFVALRRQLDPTGTFLNQHLRDLIL